MPQRLHRWTTVYDEARRIQSRLAPRVERRSRTGRLRTVAGVDVGFEDDGRTARGAVAVLSWPDLTLIDQSVARKPVNFPYVPGYLSFREVPVLLDAFAGLESLPDLLLCDGQGIAHPRRFGIACHLGLWLDRPAIGVGKSRLLGTHESTGKRRGAWTPLMDRGEIIGSVLRTREGTLPLYVSIGHRVTLPRARELVLKAAPRYRLPETTRAAHRLASGPP